MERNLRTVAVNIEVTCPKDWVNTFAIRLRPYQPQPTPLLRPAETPRLEVQHPKAKAIWEKSWQPPSLIIR